MAAIKNPCVVHESLSSRQDFSASVAGNSERSRWPKAGTTEKDLRQRWIS
jgi:hypothetical protein